MKDRGSQQERTASGVEALLSVICLVPLDIEETDLRPVSEIACIFSSTHWEQSVAIRSDS